MLLNRNASCSKGCNWLVYLAIFVILALAAFGAREPIKAKLADLLNVDQTKVEKIVHDYIENHPQEIIASLQKMHEHEQEEMMKQAQGKIKDSLDELQGKGHEISPSAGNKNGDVTVVAFLDYRCGYCKSGNATLKDLAKQDPNVKIIFKELPVLGPQSQKIAQMALAVYLIEPQKYVEFHDLTMSSSNPDEKTLLAILKQLNLDHVKVNEMMKDPRIAKELESVVNLAGQLAIRGTPAFIVGETLVPGAVDINGMKELVKEARAKKN